jgi:hypothetical protein
MHLGLAGEVFRESAEIRESGGRPRYAGESGRAPAATHSALDRWSLHLPHTSIEQQVTKLTRPQKAKNLMPFGWLRQPWGVRLESIIKCNTTIDS